MLQRATAVALAVAVAGSRQQAMPLERRREWNHWNGWNHKGWPIVAQEWRRPSASASAAADDVELKKTRIALDRSKRRERRG